MGQVLWTNRTSLHGLGQGISRRFCLWSRDWLDLLRTVFIGDAHTEEHYRKSRQDLQGSLFSIPGTSYMCWRWGMATSGGHHNDDLQSGDEQVRIQPNPKSAGLYSSSTWSTSVRRSRAAGGDLAIQTAHAMRLAAAKAFHEANCSQSPRNALRSCWPSTTRVWSRTINLFLARRDGTSSQGQALLLEGARSSRVDSPTNISIAELQRLQSRLPQNIFEEEQLSLSNWIDDIAKAGITSKTRLDRLDQGGVPTGRRTTNTGERRSRGSSSTTPTSTKDSSKPSGTTRWTWWVEI